MNVNGTVVTTNLSFSAEFLADFANVNISGLSGGPELVSGVPFNVDLFEGDNTIRLILSRGGQNTIYTLRVVRERLDVFAQTAYVKASMPDARDRFSTAVAIDGNTLVVGAPGEGSSSTEINGDEANNNAGGSGAVYVFVRNLGIWTQEAYLKASNTDIGDGFGSSVAVFGDTLAVGAIREASSSTGVNGNQNINTLIRAGAVYVFTRNNGVWSQQAYIKASNTDFDDQFGASVDLYGDTLAVGAPLEDSNASGVNGDDSNNELQNSGAVYIFNRDNDTWSQEAYLKASNSGQSDAFGSSISLDEDRIAIGAPLESSGSTGVNGDENSNSSLFSGAVYLFLRENEEWTQDTFFKASNTGQNDRFGSSVALSGNLLAVGAPFEDSDSIGVNGDQGDGEILVSGASGAAYVFSLLDGQWSQEAFVKASNTDANNALGDNFGGAVALDGNMLVVGATGEDSFATGIDGFQGNAGGRGEYGAAYGFTRSNEGWFQQCYIKASNSRDLHEFGSSLALQNGVLAVGSSNEDGVGSGVNGNQTSGRFGSGAVYVFD